MYSYKIKSYGFLILIILALSGCAIKKLSAPIEYNHNNLKLDKSRTTTLTVGDEDEVTSGGTINIKETEIITPYNDDDYVTPVTRLIKQNYKVIYHKVQVGETIEKIALKYQQTIDEIEMLNDLDPPYYLNEFQIIKIKVEKDFDENKSLATVLPQSKASSIKAPGVLKFIPPLKGSIITKFGEKTKYGTNKGINIVAKQGSKVIATANGKVIYANYDATFGYLIIIKLHNKNIITSYAHLEDIVLLKDSNVKQGDVVGYVGCTGKVNKPQLHFAVREGKIARDPMEYINY